MVLGKLPVPERPTIKMVVGQGPIALAVGAGGGCLDIFYTPLSFLSSFSLSPGDGPIQTEIVSSKGAKTKPTNQLNTFQDFLKFTAEGVECIVAACNFYQY